MKKILFSILASVVVLAACGGGGSGGGSSEETSGEASSEATAETIVLKLGHVGPVDEEHPWERYAKSAS